MKSVDITKSQDWSALSVPDLEEAVRYHNAAYWVHNAPGHRYRSQAVLADVRADVADLAALSVVDGPAGVRPMQRLNM